MLGPKTYYGYDKESRCIVTSTASDATDLINPAEVKSAVENLENVFKESMGRIANALRDMSNDANDAIIVQGTKMTGTIEDLADSVTQIPSQIVDGLNTLYEYAVRNHDDLQNQLNEEARRLVRNYEGVVRITG